MKRANTLISLIFLVVLAAPSLSVADRPARRIVRHGKLPADPKYWKFNSWYRKHSVLDVYVNGARPGHLLSALKKIEELRKRKVLIRDIVVIGGNNFAQLNARTRADVAASVSSSSEGREVLLRAGIDPALSTIAERIDLSDGNSVAKVKETLEKMKLTHSPAWVVTYRGEKYIFQGVPTVIKHFSRVGQFKKTEQQEVQKGSVELLPEPSKDDSPNNYLPTYRYRIGERRLPPGLGTFDVKPACAEAKRRRNPVYSDSKELDDFDMTFYDYKDQTQKKRAEVKSTPTVPYIEGDLYNPHRDKKDLQQNFGRFFDIRCLPTRLHYIYIGGARVEEYLEGDLAWEEQP